MAKCDALHDAHDLRIDGGGFEGRAGMRRTWWCTPNRHKWKVLYMLGSLVRMFPSRPPVSEGEMAAESLSRPARSIALAPGGRTCEFDGCSYPERASQ